MRNEIQSLAIDLNCGTLYMSPIKKAIYFINNENARVITGVKMCKSVHSPSFIYSSISIMVHWFIYFVIYFNSLFNQYFFYLLI